MFFVTYLTLNIFFSYVGRYSSCVEGQEHNVNVGTVLFNRGDIARKCWENEDLTLLSSRYVFTNVLPDTRLLKFKDSSSVNDIVAYFQLLLSVVRDSSSGRTRHLLILAMSDSIGGYLHRFVLPLARYSFYSGLIEYESMEKLYTLFRTIKYIMNTNGRGWAHAHFSDYPTFNPSPLKIVNKENNLTSTACQKFSSLPILGSSGEISIPLPFTDSKIDPVSIAVPFRGHGMLGLTSERSKYVLVKYYITSIKCLRSLDTNGTYIKKFNTRYMDWLGENILPHLYTDKFYPAFGGILKVVQTMKLYGVKQEQIDGYKMALQEKYNDFNEKEVVAESNSIFLYGVLAFILLWVFIGCLFICCNLKKKKSADKDTSAEVKSNTSTHASESLKSTASAKSKTNSVSNSTDKAKTNSVSESTDKGKSNSGSNVSDKAKSNSGSNVSDKAKSNSASNVSDKGKSNSGSNVSDKAKSNSASNVSDKATSNSASNVSDKAKSNSASNVSDKAKSNSGSKGSNKSKTSSKSTNTEKSNDTANTEDQYKKSVSTTSKSSSEKGRNEKNKTIGFVQTKTGFALKEKSKSKKAHRRMPSLEDTSKTSSEVAAPRKSTGLQKQSMETITLTSSTDKISKEYSDDLVLDYDFNTVDLTSSSEGGQEEYDQEEEEDEDEDDYDLNSLIK